MAIDRPVPERKSQLVSYLLWGSCFFGVCGIHRFYNGRPISGLIWLLTFGFLFIGQIIDLFLIPGMVREQNLESRLTDLDDRRGRLR
ncbi:TM2 domain-containing protein [Fulvimarina sp. 2208YS6-2-32]|uniref:TM2 domain-containing protein n=1 Tax=Fulvimarina uroteuthidis TaxID=3098149 RepID=A0ABU5HZ28_9HYPH|nr:TM2 domain-containing protein [Fulvimarina sp. 2208YS6-2-32]MDY8108379.1 TM2 domain-containing protein [Fulvimarina sp. 2208YS6-2-32]